MNSDFGMPQTQSSLIFTLLQCHKRRFQLQQGPSYAWDTANDKQNSFRGFVQASPSNKKLDLA